MLFFILLLLAQSKLRPKLLLKRGPFNFKMLFSILLFATQVKLRPKLLFSIESRAWLIGNWFWRRGETEMGQNSDFLFSDNLIQAEFIKFIVNYIVVLSCFVVFEFLFLPSCWKINGNILMSHNNTLILKFYSIDECSVLMG